MIRPSNNPITGPRWRRSLRSALAIVWAASAASWTAADAAPDQDDTASDSGLTPLTLQSLGVSRDASAGPRPARVIDLTSRAAARAFAPEIAVIGPRGTALRSAYAELAEKLGPEHPNLIRLLAIDLILAEPGWLGEAWLAEEFDPIGETDGSRVWLRREPAYARAIGHKLFVRDKDALFARLADHNHNVLESTTGVLPETAEAPPGTIMQIRMDEPMNFAGRVVSYEPGRIVIDYTAAHSGWIQISEPASPGWQYMIDGDPVGAFLPEDRGKATLEGLPTNRGFPPGDRPAVGDGLFLNLFAPAGAHRIELRFDPAGPRLALYLALVSLAGLSIAVGAWIGRLRSRRRTEAPKREAALGKGSFR